MRHVFWIWDEISYEKSFIPIVLKRTHFKTYTYPLKQRTNSQIFGGKVIKLLCYLSLIKYCLF